MSLTNVNKNQVDKIGNNYNKSIDLAHQSCGYVGEDKTQRMPKAFGFELTWGNIKKCLSCTVAIENQSSEPKKSPYEPKNKTNGRVLLNI